LTPTAATPALGADPGAMQPVHLSPQPLQQGIADPLRGELAEGDAVHPLHGQQRRPAVRLDHLVDQRDADAGPAGQYRDEGLVLDRLDDRAGGPGIADIAQPGRTGTPGTAGPQAVTGRLGGARSGLDSCPAPSCLRAVRRTGARLASRPGSPLPPARSAIDRRP